MQIIAQAESVIDSTARCPREAIEYGKHSRGLTRYTCKISTDSPHHSFTKNQLV